MRMKGVLTTWNDDRGFGFVAPAVGGPDVFVHISAFPEGALRPVEGDEVGYELEFSPDGKPRAARAQTLRHVPAPARVRRPNPPQRSSRLGYVAILAFGCIVFVRALVHPLPFWVAVLYGGASVVTFIAYAVDKRAAQTDNWRVPEGSLLALGVIGGWPGAIVAQQVLRHKTLKASFQWAFWISVVVNVLGFAALSWLAALPSEL
ncbi:DUF1294 domain-containing protein [Protaetiibacter larvae]|uniref:DUF1294 domain-containing protein n=1 Tax=Protaetiibacter larvae TaxID=2592654 RepID=A0A5C1YDQ4_9MICO|nr:DUF1294 domain-containing protein [Protaetiibacter larvae]